MKKFLLLSMALWTMMTAQAEVIFTENFNQEIGQLSKGDYLTDMGTDQLSWWYTNSTAAKLQVVDENLVAEHYVTQPTGKAVRFAGLSNQDLRQFNGKKEGSVFYSVLLSVKELKGNKSDYIFTLLNNSNLANNSKYARLYMRGNAEKNAFELGVSKSKESFYRMTSMNLQLNTTYLVVVQYDFVEGAKNDIVRLWINPDKSKEATPTLVCVQDTANSNNLPKGASNEEDATFINMMLLRPTKNTPTNMLVDEIKLTTTWDELWESENPQLLPSISVNTNLFFSDVLTGETYSEILTVSAENLTEDIAITHKNSEITYSPASLPKEGGNLTITLKPLTAGIQKDTIVLTSGTVKQEIAIAWNAAKVTSCATIMQLRQEAEKVTTAYTANFRFTGEAIVTHVGEDNIYLQDASAAAYITDMTKNILSTLKVGDKLGAFMATNGQNAWGIQAIEILTAPEIKNKENSVEPKVITLEKLKETAKENLFVLVKLENVIFSVIDTTYGAASVTFSQGNHNGTLRYPMDMDISAIPTKADIIGFSVNPKGDIIRVRAKEDIIDKETGTALEQTEEEQAIEIYTLSGMRVNELVKGVNIVRQGDKTYKVVK